MKLLYITNIDLKEFSGGGSGVNFATFSELKKAFDSIEIIKLEMKSDTLSKLRSKILQKIGLKRNYHFFSDNKLGNIARQFATTTKNVTTDVYFFHGYTPWIHTKPDKPYYCFNDACFATYVEIYNNKNEFSKVDLQRIYDKESKWLQKAEKVFFRSQWALDETKKAYGINGDNFINVGVGGFIEIPDRDYYMDYDLHQYNFLFIAKEFVPKGGPLVVKAIQNLRKKGIDALLWIVGEDPGTNLKESEGVKYLGFFKKSESEEKEKLIEIFKKTFAIVHPTQKDINPLVINELAYYGSPAIASNKFAIPEYLINGKSGYLLDDSLDEKELSRKMELMIKDKMGYKNMRMFSRKNAIENNTWEKVGARIINGISNG